MDMCSALELLETLSWQGPRDAHCGRLNQALAVLSLDRMTGGACCVRSVVTCSIQCAMGSVPAAGSWWLAMYIALGTEVERNDQEGIQRAKEKTKSGHIPDYTGTVHIVLDARVFPRKHNGDARL